VIFLWRRRADLNRRLYSFANCSLGPLGHVSMSKNVRLSVGEDCISVKNAHSVEDKILFDEAMLFSNLIKMHHDLLGPISFFDVLSMIKTFFEPIGHHIF
jgi:hypothetical protein